VRGEGAPFPPYPPPTLPTMTFTLLAERFVAPHTAVCYFKQNKSEREEAGDSVSLATTRVAGAGRGGDRERERRGERDREQRERGGEIEGKREEGRSKEGRERGGERERTWTEVAAWVVA
jgi:hypothetical protein